MLVELVVRNLGIIDNAHLVLEDGMTALTGETGAGKTLLVQAMQLLAGARAEGHLVGPHGDEAIVEGRFEHDAEELVIRRVVSRAGRSRAFVNGDMITLRELVISGAELVDLHGQNTHQSLLTTAAQRAALDEFAGVDLGPLDAAKKELGLLTEKLDSQGGDERSRVREMDLLQFQLDEIAAAGLYDAGEEKTLELQESLLADAVGHRDAAGAAVHELNADSGALDAMGRALAELRGRLPFSSTADRLEGITADLQDTVEELRDQFENISLDPEALAQVRSRRQQLRELCRKYGDTLEDVMAFAVESQTRLDELEHHEASAAALEAEIIAATASVHLAAKVVGDLRRTHKDALGEAVQDRFAELAMPNATLRVEVSEENPGNDVQFLFEANSGASLLPLSKVASGGELARIMLGLRLVLSDGPPTMIFDEVDAGIGGEAALAVGRALGELGRDRQVLVVTHLPQVAAAADAQISIRKDSVDGNVTSDVYVLSPGDRHEELARMLSGSVNEVAIEHARQLLAEAQVTS